MQQYVLTHSEFRVERRFIRYGTRNSQFIFPTPAFLHFAVSAWCLECVPCLTGLWRIGSSVISNLPSNSIPFPSSFLNVAVKHIFHQSFFYECVKVVILCENTVLHVLQILSKLSLEKFSWCRLAETINNTEIELIWYNSVISIEHVTIN